MNSSINNGKIHQASHPFEIVQIDHAKLHITLVDDVSKEPIGQPWLTLAVDNYSRMIAGYSLSFDPPSETSTAKCVTHAIQPKNEWLQSKGIVAKWNVSGLMKTIQANDDVSFSSGKFQDACIAHGINLDIRSVRQPQDAGYIELILGRIEKAIRDVSDATLTLSEFDAYLATFICNDYHDQLHTSLGMSPTQKWDAGISENGVPVFAELNSQFRELAEISI